MILQSSAPTHLPALTGLRGLAASWVFIAHLWPTLLAQLPELFGSTIPRWVISGSMGVDFFFVLSGYIMAHVHAKDFSQDLRFSSVRSFLCLRLARIYPLHLFWLAMTVLTVVSLPGFDLPYRTEQFDWASLPIAALLLQNWIGVLASIWNGPTWSLSAEWFAYLVFPVLMWACLRAGTKTVIATALVCLMIAPLIHVVADRNVIAEMGRAGMIRMMTEFVLGIVVWRLGQTQPCPQRWLHVLLACLIGLGVAMYLGFGSPVLVIVLVVATLAKAGSRKLPIMSSALVQKLGQLSFSIYLSHWLLIQIMNWVGRHESFTVQPLELRISWILMSLLVMWIAAEFSFRLIEVPGRTFLRRLLLPRAYLDGILRKQGASL